MCTALERSSITTSWFGGHRTKGTVAWCCGVLHAIWEKVATWICAAILVVYTAILTATSSGKILLILVPSRSMPTLRYYIDALKNTRSVSLSIWDHRIWGRQDSATLWEETITSSKRHPNFYYVNMSPYDLFGVYWTMIQERFMIANVNGVPLFPFINYIRTVHELLVYETPVEHPVANIGVWSHFHVKEEGEGGRGETKGEGEGRAMRKVLECWDSF